MYAAKKLISVILVIILSSCARTFGPEDSQDSLYTQWNHLAPADVYVVYLWWDSVRAAHDTLLKDSAEFVEKKCGKNSEFHLTNHKLYPSRMVGMKLAPAFISADITCGPKKLGDSDIHKVMNKAEAEKTCRDLGLGNHKKEFAECVVELTTK